MANLKAIPDLDKKAEYAAKQRQKLPLKQDPSGTPPHTDPTPDDNEDMDSDGLSDGSSSDSQYVPTFSFVGSPQESDAPEPPASSDSEG